MNFRNILFMAVVLIAVIGCTKYESNPVALTCADGTILSCPTLANKTETVPQVPVIKPIEEVTNKTTPVVTKPIETTPVNPNANVIAVNEGELVKINPKVSDKDGDKITLTFSKPLNEKGEWQTKEGDAGTYNITVTASDGKSTASKVYSIIVNKVNYAPTIEIPDTVTVNETDKVVLKPVVKDKDGDRVEVSYAGWMTSSEYTTTYNDAGEHVVTVVASDGKAVTTKNINVVVMNVNREPKIFVEKDPVQVTEGGVARIIYSIIDSDKDKITTTFSKPFDQTGAWQTKVGDAGTYHIEITAGDGTIKVYRNVTVEVLNANLPPVFQEMKPFTINVGENLKNYVKPSAKDPEGKSVSISYSGWVTDIDYVVKEKDAGSHILVITYSDGVNKVTQNVNLTVNLPPVFIQ